MTVATAKRSQAIVGLRGLTVVAIMAHHYMPADFFSFNVAKAFNALLITIGGYFFANAMIRETEALDSDSFIERGKAAGRLFLQQIQRVWPLLAFVILLYVGLAIADGGTLTTQILSTWWLYLIDLGNVPKVMYGAEAFPAHFWTVAAQDQVVLLMAFAMTAFGFSRLRDALPWIIAAGFVARVVATLAFMPENPALALEMPWSVLDVACIGMLARLATDDASRRGTVRRGAYTAAAIVGFVWTTMPNTNATFYGMVPLAFSLLSVGLVLSATDEMRGGAMARAICHPWLVFLGTIGLSLFFLHPFVNTVLLLAWPKMTGALMPWWAFAFVGPMIAIPAAWAMHIAIEKPLTGRRKAAVTPKLAAA